MFFVTSRKFVALNSTMKLKVIIRDISFMWLPDDDFSHH